MTIPKITDTREKWSEWLESKYPFAPVFEQSLCKRMPYKRAEPGTPQELDDIRGIRDREQAIDFAVMWARLNVTVANGWRTKRADPVAYIPNMPDFGFNNRPEDDRDEFGF